jgi:hypothetical protein
MKWEWRVGEKKTWKTRGLRKMWLRCCVADGEVVVVEKPGCVTL